MTVFIILNYKTYQDTSVLVKNLLKQDIAERKIIIVDNLSPNGSFEILKKEFCGVSTVDVISSGENGGYAKGNNYGLRFARKYNPDYVCIINNDVKFSIKDIEVLERRYGNLANVGLVAPVQKVPSGKNANFYRLSEPSFWDDVISYLPYVDKLPMFRHKYYENTSVKNIQQVDIIPGAFIFTSYKLLELYNFMDEQTFLFCEERFLGKKLKENGIKNYILLDIYYIHDHSTTINSEASLVNQLYMILDGRIKYTYQYRTYPKLKSAILKCMCHFFVFLVHVRNRLSRTSKCVKSKT